MAFPRWGRALLATLPKPLRVLALRVTIPNAVLRSSAKFYPEAQTGWQALRAMLATCPPGIDMNGTAGCAVRPARPPSRADTNTCAPERINLC